MLSIKALETDGVSKSKVHSLTCNSKWSNAATFQNWEHRILCKWQVFFKESLSPQDPK